MGQGPVSREFASARVFWGREGQALPGRLLQGSVRGPMKPCWAQPVGSLDGDVTALLT